MKRLLARRPGSEEPFPKDKEPISQRWVIIIVASVFGGTWVGSEAGALATTFGIVLVLHSVMR
ncbi:MAG TPA: hypothetical protein VKZ82_15550 [Nonomuraea sp.]|nr:hypothetical protein [Nonomuraea sp.]